MTYIELDLWDLLLAALLLFIHGAVSLRLRLGLEKQLAIAALRMIVQLGLVAILLKTLFALVSPLWTALVALAMILFAGREAQARQSRPLAGFWTYGLGTGAMLLTGFLVTLFALSTQIRPDPWYDPRYSLPLLGMILGNTMTGISLGFDCLFSGVVREKVAIEARLALGHSRMEALRQVLREAVRTALIPIVNAMAAAGLVSLPGMMTGQILAGADPIDAVKYQLLVMFLIAGGTSIGVVLAVTGGALRITDSRHRLRLDRLIPGPRNG